MVKSIYVVTNFVSDTLAFWECPIERSPPCRSPPCIKGCAVLPQWKDCFEGGGDDCVRDSITADDGRRRGAQPWPW